MSRALAAVDPAIGTHPLDQLVARNAKVLGGVGQAHGAARSRNAVQGLNLGRLLLHHDTELVVLVSQVSG
ncbi:hypothetical protein D9M69_639220 [compost metagenome]